MKQNIYYEHQKFIQKKQVVAEQPVSVVPVAEASFGDKLNNIKSVFQAALSKAKDLQSQMSEKSKELNGRIASLQEKVKYIKSVEKSTAKFISNIEGLV